MPSVTYSYEPVKLKNNSVKTPNAWTYKGQPVTRAVVKGRDAIHKTLEYYNYGGKFAIELETIINIGEYYDMGKFGTDEWNGSYSDYRQVRHIYVGLSIRNNTGNTVGTSWSDGDQLNMQPIKFKLHIAAGCKIGAQMGVGVLNKNEWHPDGTIQYARPEIRGIDFDSSSEFPAIDLEMSRASGTGKWNNSYPSVMLVNPVTNNVRWRIGELFRQILQRNDVPNNTYWIARPYLRCPQGSYLEITFANGKVLRQDLSGQTLQGYPNEFSGWGNVILRRPERLYGWVNCATLYNVIGYQNVYGGVNCGERASLSAPAVTCGEMKIYEREY